MERSGTVPPYCHGSCFHRHRLATLRTSLGEELGGGISCCVRKAALSLRRGGGRINSLDLNLDRLFGINLHAITANKRHFRNISSVPDKLLLYTTRNGVPGLWNTAKQRSKPEQTLSGKLTAINLEKHITPYKTPPERTPTVR